MGKKITKILLCILVGSANFSACATSNAKIDDGLSSFLRDEAYQKAVFVDNVSVITQDISCGYAVIEMFSEWWGGDITEESLFAEYGKVVTATGKSFAKEMNKQFPQYTTVMHPYSSTSSLLSKIYTSLQKGIPVPIQFAALYDDGNEAVWTLHYGIVVALDVPKNSVSVVNPYGYNETYTIEDFLTAMSFARYENMPLYLKFAFAVGIFEKNTVFILEPK